MDSALDRRRARAPEVVPGSHPLVLGDHEEDVAGHPLCALLRHEPSAHRLDPVQRPLSVEDASSEPAQVPDDERAHIASLHAFDAGVPERARGVAAGPVQLLDDVRELKPLALADALNRLPLELRGEERIALSATDAADPDVTYGPVVHHGSILAVAVGATC